MPDRVILIADDEPVVRRLLQASLTAAGYNVLPAVDGTNALEISRAFPGSIDLLLTDIQMPRLDGISLARQLVVERPGTRVLLISGYESGTMLEKRVSLPFMRKPFAPSQLVERVAQLLAA